MKQKPSWNALLARGFDFREDSNTKIYNVLHHIIIEEMIENAKAQSCFAFFSYSKYPISSNVKRCNMSMCLCAQLFVA